MGASGELEGQGIVLEQVMMVARTVVEKVLGVVIRGSLNRWVVWRRR